jgi:hypothetical protein
MHKTCSYIFLFFVALLCISTIKVGAQSKGNELDVLYESQKQLRLFLEKIPHGSETKFGFNNREEFDIAIVQNPYNVVLPNDYFYTDNILDTSKTYIYHSNYWEIPISVNGKFCCLLSGKFTNDEFSVFSIGGSSVAMSINNLNARSENGKGTNYILNLAEQRKLYLISSNSKGDFRSSKGIEICYNHNAKYKNEVALNVILENEKKNLIKSMNHEN